MVGQALMCRNELFLECISEVLWRLRVLEKTRLRRKEEFLGENLTFSRKRRSCFISQLYSIN
jgi:hypothetical protein